MDMADTLPTANIDAKLKELADRLRSDEETIKRLEAEADQIRERIGKLEEAKIVILRELGSQEDYSDLVDGRPRGASHSELAEDDGGTLKARTLLAVRQSASKEGLSASEVTKALTEGGLGSHVTPRVFYSMVYLTLMRLTETGELKFRKGEKGRRFYAPPARSSQ